MESLPLSRLALCISGAFAVGLHSLAAAETLPPKPDRYFNDYAHVVSPNDALRLNERLAQFERETSTQLIVAVYRAMQSDSSIDDYTYRVKETWHVGQKGLNNGAVLFVFVDDHKMFIQTNYGLEGALPDATCFDITHNIIAPYFKRSDYLSGLNAGITAMMQAVRGEYKGSGRTYQEAKSKNTMPVGLIVFLVVLFFIIIANRAGRRRGGYWFSGMGGPYVGGWSGGGWSGGGSSGGGFSGFSGGGGSGGGGGAGSSW